MNLSNSNSFNQNYQEMLRNQRSQMVQQLKIQQRKIRVLSEVLQKLDEQLEKQVRFLESQEGNILKCVGKILEGAEVGEQEGGFNVLRKFVKIDFKNQQLLQQFPKMPAYENEKSVLMEQVEKICKQYSNISQIYQSYNSSNSENLYHFSQGLKYESLFFPERDNFQTIHAVKQEGYNGDLLNQAVLVEPSLTHKAKIQFRILKLVNCQSLQIGVWNKKNAQARNFESIDFSGNNEEGINGIMSTSSQIYVLTSVNQQKFNKKVSYKFRNEERGNDEWGSSLKENDLVQVEYLQSVLNGSQFEQVVLSRNKRKDSEIVIEFEKNQVHEPLYGFVAFGDVDLGAVQILGQV
ncbi:hypothetical protein PPERSA_04561 [Pseudocohnilembus persalinus]|uniref:Uncharacterized protein n=1 Tax=Pseudocohnilembus persalinus TaxID=266149 RepID=A0A0V0QED4_PSEPJ|nr:hypothetical protein PPERSA_04561 [Pseudocohnilembus persalinus]|eukprot:KRX00540.1 hypothetical protein PPERSA_04561 [Pseudocohnilembus persalinus]